MNDLITTIKEDIRRALTNEHVLDNVTIAWTELLMAIRPVILMPLIIRKFGLADYGIWVQCMNLTAMLSGVAGFNLQKYLVRHVAEESDPARRGCIYISQLLSLAAANIALILIMMGISRLVDPGSLFLKDRSTTEFLFVALMSVPFIALHNYNLSYLRAIQQIRFQAILSLIISVLEVILIIIGFLFMGFMEAFWIIFLWRCTTSVICTGIIISRNGWIAPQSSYIKNGWRFSSPLLLSNLSTIVLSRMDKLLIGGFFGSAALGLFGLSSSIAGGILCLVAPYTVTLLPKISGVWNRDETAARNMVEQYANFFLLTVIPVLLFMVFFGDNLIQLFAKTSMADPQTYANLILLSLGNTVWGLCLLEGTLLYGERNTVAIASLRLVAAMLYIILNYFFLKRFGLKVAGINMLVSHILLYFGYRIAIKRNIRIRFKQMVFCMLMSMLLCSIMLFLNLNMKNILTIIPACLSYVLAYSIIIYTSRIKVYGNDESSDW